MKFASGAKKKKKEIMCFSFAFESHVARAFKTLSSIHWIMAGEKKTWESVYSAN